MGDNFFLRNAEKDNNFGILFLGWKSGFFQIRRIPRKNGRKSEYSINWMQNIFLSGSNYRSFDGNARMTNMIGNLKRSYFKYFDILSDDCSVVFRDDAYQ